MNKAEVKDTDEGFEKAAKGWSQSEETEEYCTLMPPENCSEDPFAIDIDNLIKEILQKINNYCQLSWMKENSGSHYSGVREPSRDEYDFIFYPTQVQCRIEPSCDHPCYCHVFITNRQELPLEFQEILGPDDELTPSKYREYVFPVFDRIVREYVLPTNYQLKIVENKSICPAYTVEYVTETDISRDIDLVPSLQVQEPHNSFMEWKTKKLTEEERMDCPIYVVPKKLAANGEELELWRVSYSAVEKKILRDKCDWVERNVIRSLKDCLRFERIDDDNNKLCSYHIMNNCLHFFEKTKRRSRSGWRYIKKAMDSLICALQAKDIRHFFIPSFNLLQDVDEEECQQFIEKLTIYRNN